MIEQALPKHYFNKGLEVIFARNFRLKARRYVGAGLNPGTELVTDLFSRCFLGGKRSKLKDSPHIRLRAGHLSFSVPAYSLSYSPILFYTPFLTT